MTPANPMTVNPGDLAEVKNQQDSPFPGVANHVDLVECGPAASGGQLTWSEQSLLKAKANVAKQSLSWGETPGCPQFLDHAVPEASSLTFQKCELTLALPP